MSLKKIPNTLILVPDLNIPGGVANYYRTLKLDDNNNIAYFTITRAKPQSILASVFRLLERYILFSIKLVKYKYRVVVINPSLDEGRSFHRDMIFILITHLFNCKSIVFFRGWFDPYEQRIKKSRLKSFLFQISYAKVNEYIVLGNIFKRKLIDLGVPSNCNFFTETTVADSSYLEEFNIERKFFSYRKEVIFVFLSRIEKEKGIYIAINAFKKFQSAHPQRKCSLIIAGDGRDLAEVKLFIKTEAISNIIFTGNVSLETKKKVLFESHIMILPSFTEGLPNVILEGMLYGMPIIARAVGGIPEIVEQGVNGYLTESYDANIFETFLANLANDINLYKSISERNHQTAVEKFSSEKVKERILNIIHNS